MPTGRKAIPTVQKILAGNPGHRPLNDREPQPAALDAAWDVPPPEVAAVPLAAAYWGDVVPMLRQSRQVAGIDRGALVALCLEWARYLTAIEDARTEGHVVRLNRSYRMANPHLGIASTALKACRALWAELGMTPASRTRVQVTGDTAGDVFDEFDHATPPGAQH